MNTLFEGFVGKIQQESEIKSSDSVTKNNFTLTNFNSFGLNNTVPQGYKMQSQKVSQQLSTNPFVRISYSSQKKLLHGRDLNKEKIKALERNLINEFNSNERIQRCKSLLGLKIRNYTNPHLRSKYHSGELIHQSKPKHSTSSPLFFQNKSKQVIKNIRKLSGKMNFPKSTEEMKLQVCESLNPQDNASVKASLNSENSQMMELNRSENQLHKSRNSRDKLLPYKDRSACLSDKASRCSSKPR